MKSACITQASEIDDCAEMFIDHSRKIFDEIHIVIHNSDIGIPDDFDNVYFYNANYETYFLPLSWNEIINNSIKDANFVTMLDTDEFINLTSKTYFQEILRNNRFNAAFYAHWRPAIGTEKPQTHINVGKRVYLTSPHLGSNRKTFYNLQNNTFIAPNHGNHDYRGSRKLLSLGCRTEHAVQINHLAFHDMTHMRSKLSDRDGDRFWTKISECTPEITKKYGENWRYRKDISYEDFVYICANYRERDRRNVKQVKPSELVEMSPLNITGESIEQVRSALKKTSRSTRKSSDRLRQDLIREISDSTPLRRKALLDELTTMENRNIMLRPSALAER